MDKGKTIEARRGKRGRLRLVRWTFTCSEECVEARSQEVTVNSAHSRPGNMSRPREQALPPRARRIDAPDLRLPSLPGTNSHTNSHTSVFAAHPAPANSLK